MRPTVSQYAQALNELSSTVSDAGVVARNFLGLLKRRGESDKLPAVLDCLERLERTAEKRVAVTAVVAHEPGADTKEVLLQKAKTLFPDQVVDISYTVDARVMGGVRFRSEEKLYDATVFSELSALRKGISK